MSVLRVTRAELSQSVSKVRVTRAELLNVNLGSKVRVTRAELIVSATLHASAGLDQTVEGLDVVQLDGSNSTGMTTFAWTQTVGTTVTILDAATAKPTFVAPGLRAGDSLTFLLTVGDGSTTQTDTVVVAVNPHVQWFLGLDGIFRPIRSVSL